MKLNKVIKTMGIIIGATTLFAMPVFASQQGFGFFVELEGEQTARSDFNPKDDYEQAAYVHCTSGDITNTDEFYLSVHDEIGYDYTGNRRISSATATYYIDYNQGWAGAGQPMQLYGTTYAYAVHVYGYWYS